MLLELRGSGQLIQRVIERANEAAIDLDIIVEEDQIPEGLSFKDVSIGDLVMASLNTEQMKDYELKEQQKWINDKAGSIKELTGKSPVGLYPKNWQIGQDTHVAAVRSGISYLFSDNIPRDYGPKVRLISPVWWKWLLRGKTPLTTISKSQVSLWEWNKLMGIKGGDNLLRAMTADMTRIRNAGGLYLGILDPTVLDRESALDLPQQMAALMDSLGIWRTNTESLMNRFGGWRGLRVASKYVTPERVRLNLSNEGKYKLNDVIYEVHLPTDITEIKVTAHIVGFNATDVRWNNKRGICSFTIPKMEPGDNVIMYIDFKRDLEEGSEFTL